MTEPGSGQPPQQPLQPVGDVYGGPPPTPPQPPGGAPPLPWEDRERRGFFPALIDTVKLFVTSPSEAYARAKERGDYLSPILYAVLVGWAMGIIGSLWQLVLPNGAALLIGRLMPPELRSQYAQASEPSAFGFILGVILTPVILLIVLFIWSGIVHLFLMMLGGHKQSSSGFEGTFRAISYAQTAALAQIVPFVGVVIAFVWGLVLEVLGLVRMHRTSQGKALGALLLPIVLCCVCVGVAAALFMASIMAAISGSMQH